MCVWKFIFDKISSLPFNIGVLEAHKAQLAILYHICTWGEQWRTRSARREDLFESAGWWRTQRDREKEKIWINLFECHVYWLECSILFLIQCHSWDATVNEMPLLQYSDTLVYTHTHTHTLIPLVLLDLSHCPFAVLWGSSQNRWRRAAAAQHVSDRLLIRRCCMIFWGRLHLAPSASNHLTVLCWCRTRSDGKRAVCRCKRDTERDGGYIVKEGKETEKRRISRGETWEQI